MAIEYQSGYDQLPHRPAPAVVGMWLFLASLTMLFIAGMLIYCLFRLHVFGTTAGGPIPMPQATWISTFVLLGASYSIHRAVAAVKISRMKSMRFWLSLTSILAAVFLAIQFPCLWKILAAHRAAQAQFVATHAGPQSGGVPLYGLVFCLILLHALHVVGGIVAMAVVTAHALDGRYDHENYMGLKHAALYWHFLDIVWLVMFTTFMLTK